MDDNENKSNTYKRNTIVYEKLNNLELYDEIQLNLEKVLIKYAQYINKFYSESDNQDIDIIENKEIEMSMQEILEKLKKDLKIFLKS